MTKKQQNKRPIRVAGALFPYPFWNFDPSSRLGIHGLKSVNLGSSGSVLVIGPDRARTWKSWTEILDRKKSPQEKIGSSEFSLSIRYIARLNSEKLTFLAKIKKNDD